uniref:Uncharacterized protein n=1 Tax=Tanacetum cinerariifolium TaxID=118510 RepID=A0A6L2LL16_TANCI|nr:hypothetical protein [Tanacetum cinerariifolium]
MTWHATGKCTEPGLATDGFNPFGNLSQAYSMWPVILTTYNLPPWLCMKDSSFMLTLLIYGLKFPGKDIDVYLRPLIDDLKVLWALKGVETIDIATGQKFNMRAMVLWTINDFLALSSLSGWSGQGYLACPTCNKDTLYLDSSATREYPSLIHTYLNIYFYLADNARAHQVARESRPGRIPDELFPSTYPGRHVTRDEYPQ